VSIDGLVLTPYNMIMLNISQETKKVFEIIKKHEPIRPSAIVKILHISNKTLYKHLNILFDEELISKTGEHPQIFYITKKDLEEQIIINNSQDQFIEQNYIYVAPNGEIIRGLNGFHHWCQKNKFDIEKEKKLFIEEFKKNQKYKKQNLISAKKIILSGKKKIYLDDIFFSNFYTIGHFGKTKLGQLVYLGKSSQNKKIISEVAQLVRESVLEIINKFNIKLICYIPPTIDRKIQFMSVFKKWLKINLNEIQAIKIPSATKVPQKTLRKLEDRIINAQTTIAIDPNQIIDNNILIIDDATGSGATLNETTHKIRKITQKKIKIIGYSIIGSYKNFDVISEV